MAMTKKEALLKAAKELFGECGYTETTFKKISERAGVALGLLTHHYGKRKSFFLPQAWTSSNAFMTFCSGRATKARMAVRAC